MPTDTVELYIDGELYTNIMAYSIKYDLLSGASTFACDVSGDIRVNPVVQSSTFEWRISGRSVMKGFIDKVETRYAKGSYNNSIYGRDMMQVLLDNYILKPKVYKGKTLKQIIADVWSTSSKVSEIKIVNVTKKGASKTVPLTPAMELYPITFEYTARAEALMSQLDTMATVRTDYGATLFDFISQLCNSIGLIMYNSQGTDTILIDRLIDPVAVLIGYDPTGTVSGENPYSINNTPGYTGNVIDCKYTMDTSGFYKYLKIVGQAESEQDLNAETGEFSTVKTELRIDKIEGDSNSEGNYRLGYGGVKRFKVYDVNSIDTNAWSKTRDQIVNNALITQARALYNFEYTLGGHSQDSLAPYSVNKICTVSDDYITGDTVSMMVYSVEFKGSKTSGRTTKLGLVLPVTDAGQLQTVLNRRLRDIILEMKKKGAKPRKQDLNL